jgi:transposase
VATVLIEQADGSVAKETREYGAFKRDLVELVAWFTAERIECAVMESTGVYWKSVYTALEAAGIPALVLRRTLFHREAPAVFCEDRRVACRFDWYGERSRDARAMRNAEGLGGAAYSSGS